MNQGNRPHFANTCILQAEVAVCVYNRWVVCQKQVPRAWTSNHIPQYLWDVITSPCPWYLPLVHKYSVITKGQNRHLMMNWLIQKLIPATCCVFVHTKFYTSNHQYSFSDKLSPHEAAKRKTNLFRSILSWPFLAALSQRSEREKQELVDQLFRFLADELVHDISGAPNYYHHAHIWIKKIHVQ